MSENACKATEIEVTPSMLEEGVRVYLEYCPDSGVGDRIDTEMVFEIFKAMEIAKVSESAI